MHEKSCSGWQHDILRAARDTHDREREREREREWNGVNEKEREYKSGGGGTFHFICVLSYFFILYNSLSISNIRERDGERKRYRVGVVIWDGRRRRKSIKC
jgi:hypothetical protein